MKPTVCELFAGAGGLALGFEMAGFQIVVANDVWKDASETYIRNHPSTKFFLGDINEREVKEGIISFCKKTGCDVIIGGPPCQSYSLAGLRNIDDPRGKLFEKYVEIVSELEPEIFVMENVRGILTMKHYKDDLSVKEKKNLSRFIELNNEKNRLILLRKQNKNNPNRFIFSETDGERLRSIRMELKQFDEKLKDHFEPVTEKIKKRFKKMGYNVEYRVLNSADYGVPQKRERVIFIGRKEGGSIIFPPPTHFEKTITGLGDWIGIGNVNRWMTVREAIGDLEDAEENPNINHIFTRHSPEFEKKISNTPMGQNIFGSYSDAFYRCPPDMPSRTVKENHGGVFIHYSKNRVMTPRELARLQSFPDDYIFCGSKSSILKQIGNAVPVMLAFQLAKAVNLMLLTKAQA